MLDVQKICQRLNQIAGQIHILCDYFHLVSVVEPKYYRRLVIQTGHFKAYLIGFVQIVRLQIDRQ